MVDFFHGKVHFMADVAGWFLYFRIVLFIFFISLDIEADLAVEFIVGKGLYSVAGLVEAGVATVAVDDFVFVLTLCAEANFAVGLEDKF